MRGVAAFAPLGRLFPMAALGIRSPEMLGGLMSMPEQLKTQTSFWSSAVFGATESGSSDAIHPLHSLRMIQQEAITDCDAPRFMHGMFS